MFGGAAVQIKPGEQLDESRVNQSQRGVQIAQYNMQEPEAANPGDGRKSICMVVNNQSGGALLGARFVKSDVNGPRWRITGYAGATDVPDGVLDGNLVSTGVADNAWCLMVISGPAILTSDGTGTIAYGDNLTTAANGQVVNFSGTPTVAEIATRCGVSEAAVAASAGTTFEGDVRHLM